jgi:hypothetical protein
MKFYDWFLQTCVCINAGHTSSSIDTTTYRHNLYIAVKSVGPPVERNVILEHDESSHSL